MNIITETIERIKEYIGLDLTPCPDLPELYELGGEKYFNVILNSPVFYSEEYNKLLKLSNSNAIIHNVEPNGYKRLSLFVK